MRVTALFALLLSFLSSCVFAQKNKTWPKVADNSFNKRIQIFLSGSVPFIEVDSLAAKNLNDYTILDTRDKEEYMTSRIPGAIYVGPDFEISQVKGLDQEKPVVVYCSIGYRSEKYGEDLKENGFSNVYNLYGGIFEWVNSGEDVQDEDGKAIKEIHTYNAGWGKFVSNPHYKKIH